MFIEPSRADEADYSQIHKVLFGCLPADLMHPCDYEELHARLADLIEPEERTCHAVRIAVPFDPRDFPDDLVEVYQFRCSECSVLLEDDWSFCPNCGARVVANE